MLAVAQFVGMLDSGLTQIHLWGCFFYTFYVDLDKALSSCVCQLLCKPGDV